MQYAGRNPYGDIYSVNNSAVDNIAKRIYAEQQQKELQRRQESKMLDDEFGKNLANVKSVDIPEITQAYNEFKQKHIALQKKGNKVTPEDQMALMISKAAVNEKINGSIQDKEYLKLRANEGKGDKKGRYNQNFNTIIQDLLNTPTSKRNRDNDDAILLNQYSFPDLAKVTGNMVGLKPQEFRLPTGKPSTKGELYDDELVFNKFNHPNKMYENAFLEISTRPDREAFERVVDDSLSDQEKEALKTRYFAKINSPEFKAIYGEVQPFPESAEKTELGKATALAVMSAVDKLDLKPIRTESKLNKDAVMKKELDDWTFKNDKTFRQQKVLEAIRQGNREALVRLRKQYEKLDEEEMLGDVDDFIKSQEDEAKASAPKKEEGTLGMPTKANPIILESFSMKDPVTGKNVTPSGINLLYNGNFKIIYPSENMEDKEITRKEYKAGLVNKVFNTKTKIGQISKPKKGEFDDLK